ncbi:MAG: zinc ribbon domain-containing protein [Gammaproteobacteria bacterium]
MPIYEYQCEHCGHKFETMQRMSDDPLTDCPACQESALRKLISAVSFKLKGQGWYESDFKNAPKAAAKSDADGAKTGTDEGAQGDKKAGAVEKESDSNGSNGKKRDTALGSSAEKTRDSTAQPKGGRDASNA